MKQITIRMSDEMLAWLKSQPEDASGTVRAAIAAFRVAKRPRSDKAFLDVDKLIEGWFH